jgi:hypothetical protein
MKSKKALCGIAALMAAFAVATMPLSAQTVSNRDVVGIIAANTQE